MDFRASPIKSITNFLLYLFLDRKFQPSTLDGYRSAFADKLGNIPVKRVLKSPNMNFAKVEWRGGAFNREGPFVQINTVFMFSNIWKLIAFFPDNFKLFL